MATTSIRKVDPPGYRTVQVSEYVGTIICDGGCGARVHVASQRESDTLAGTLMGIVEILGWTTRDVKGKKRKKDMETYCAFCQERAQRIVNGR